MSESDNIEQAVDGALRSAVTQAAALGRMVAQLREQQQQRAARQEEAASRELQRRYDAERQYARVMLSQADHDGWWNTASTQRVASVVATAHVWKDRDPDIAKLASRLDDRVQARWGITPSARIDALSPEQRRHEAEQLIAVLAIDELDTDDPLRQHVGEIQQSASHQAQQQEQQEPVEAVEEHQSQVSAEDAQPVTGHDIIQASAQQWANDPDREMASREDVHEYADDQVWLQLLSPAVQQVDDLPGFDQVDIEDPVYGATETTLMLHPSWSGPAGPNAVILSATDGNMAIREFGHDPAPLTHQEAAERLGVPTASFQQAVDHLETPLHHSGNTYQGIIDRIEAQDLYDGRPAQQDSGQAASASREHTLDEFEQLLRSNGMDEKTIEARLLPERANAKPAHEAAATPPRSSKSKGRTSPGMGQQRDTERGR